MKIRDPETGRFVAHEAYERSPLTESGREYRIELSAREQAELRESDRQLSLDFDEDAADEDEIDEEGEEEFLQGDGGGAMPGREDELSNLDYSDTDLSDLSFDEDEANYSKGT